MFLKVVYKEFPWKYQDLKNSAISYRVWLLTSKPYTYTGCHGNQAPLVGLNSLLRTLFTLGPRKSRWCGILFVLRQCTQEILNCHPCLERAVSVGCAIFSDLTGPESLSVRPSMEGVAYAVRCHLRLDSSVCPASVAITCFRDCNLSQSHESWDLTIGIVLCSRLSKSCFFGIFF